jgi:hypothetical protein
MRGVIHCVCRNFRYEVLDSLNNLYWILRNHTEVCSSTIQTRYSVTCVACFERTTVFTLDNLYNFFNHYHDHYAIKGVIYQRSLPNHKPLKINDSEVDNTVSHLPTRLDITQSNPHHVADSIEVDDEVEYQTIRLCKTLCELSDYVLKARSDPRYKTSLLNNNTIPDDLKDAILQIL